MLDRFNVGPLLRDHVRSTWDLRYERPDWVARFALLGVPVVAGAVSWVIGWEIGRPEFLAPVAGLLSGALFGAVGQLFSIRARIADSVSLSSNGRLRSHFRESVSGLLLASLSSLLLALLSAVLALFTASSSGVDPITGLIATWRHQVLLAGTAVCVFLVSFTLILFWKMIRRLYTSYLEAFEGGQYLDTDRARMLQGRQLSRMDGESSLSSSRPAGGEPRKPSSS